MFATFKNAKYGFTALCMLVLLVSACSQGRNDWSDSTALSEQGHTYVTTAEAIEKMASEDWQSPDLFNTVQSQYIQESKSLSETDRVALRGKLYHTYADQLIRTCKNILASDCATSHATLNAAYKEYNDKDFSGYVPTGTDDMKSAYNLHNEQLKFYVSSSYGVPLKTFLDGYDASYDNKVRAEAQKIRATNPTCTAIKQKVSEAHVNEVLSQRKQNYYTALASKFCAANDPSRGEYNRLQSILGNAKNSAALLNKIDAHWGKIQAQKDNQYDQQAY